jgi:hypothetical protein
MANNTLLKNAAYSGFIAGCLQGRKISSTTAADYADMVAAALVFAAAVDTAIANDATISGGTGIILLPATDDEEGAVMAKSMLMHNICAGVMAGAWAESATTADYSTQVAAIAALYGAADNNLTIP